MDKESALKSICENCKWYDDFNGICCNGDSPNRADYVSEDEICEAYEEG